jgi:hypothetical protein
VIDRCLAVLCVLTFGTSAPEAGAVVDPPARAHAMLAQYASLPLRFEPMRANDGSMRFVARGANYAIAVSAQGAHLAFGAAQLDLRFVDADRGAVLEGVARDATRIHRIRDGDRRDDVDVPAYARVAASRVYPGIDIVFHGRGRELEYDVVVAPGADLSRFAFRIEGSDSVALNEAGDLLIASGGETVVLPHPVAWQENGEARHPVASDFSLDADGCVHIRVGDYDPTRALLIDPVVSYATFVGGASFEQGTAIAVDKAGNAYVTGYTGSTDFPLANALDRSLGRKGDVDVFVSKLNAAGTGLVWSTYLGGAKGTDRAIGIAVDADGSVYVTGQTSGTDFPTSANAWQKAVTGGAGFVAKLTPAGNALAYSTYVAGATPSAIGVDAAGSAYVTGSATSSFVTTPNALRTATGNPGGATGFVLKLDANGAAPHFATFLGGSGGDDGTSLALDAQGNAYVGGWTTSSDFPVRNAFQSARSGGKDGFVAKLANDGAALVYSTLLGGALDDAVNAIAIDGAGNAYVAGETYSSDFPVKDGFQRVKAGRNLVDSSVGNAFVVKLAPAGSGVVYASFLGGEVCETPCQLLFGPLPQYQADAAYAIAVDAEGHAYVGGIARSYTFPLVDSASPGKQQDNEDSAFVAKVAISGRSLLWSTFLRTGYGEPDNEWTRFPTGAATGIAVDPDGAVYVTGDADSASNFKPTASAFQTVSKSGPAAIVVKFPAPPPMTLTTSNPASDTRTPVTLTATVAGPAIAGSVTFMDGASWIGSGTLVANSVTASVTLPAGIHALNAVLRAPGVITDTADVMQVVDVALVCTSP